MSGCPHTSFRKGKRVIVTLSDGNKIIDKYVESKSGVVILERTGRLSLKKVRVITIFRGQDYEHRMH